MTGVQTCALPISIAGAAAIGNRVTATDRAITDGIIVRTSTIATDTALMAVITVAVITADIAATDITADTAADYARGLRPPHLFCSRAPPAQPPTFAGTVAAVKTSSVTPSAWTACSTAGQSISGHKAGRHCIVI